MKKVVGLDWGAVLQKLSRDLFHVAMACLLIIVFARCGYSQSSSCYGRLAGGIFDPETKKLVNADFILYVFKQDSEPIPLYIEKTKGGRFSFQMECGAYYVYFVPIFNEAGYCHEPNPLNLYSRKYPDYIKQQYSYPFEIKKSMVTRLNKMATIGGLITVSFVDEKGNKVDLNDYEEIESPVLIYRSKFDDDQLSISGPEMELGYLLPDNYELILEYTKRSEDKNIVIRRSVEVHPKDKINIKFEVVRKNL